MLAELLILALCIKKIREREKLKLANSWEIRFCCALLMLCLSLAMVSQVQPSYAVGSTVNNVSTVCDNYTFKNTKWGILNFNVEMPDARSYAWIYATGTNHGDPSNRLFEIYVNNVKVLSQSVPTTGFSVSCNILSNLRTGTNTIGITLTTWEVPAGVYWSVSSWINAKYTASQHIFSGKNWFSPYYMFKDTQWTVVNFGSNVPNGLVAGWIEVSGQSFGDTSRRLVKVYVDGAEITPSGGLNVGPTFTWRSPDIINNLALKRSVRIGIMLTTWKAPNDCYWRVSAAMDTSARYEVWPDSDTRWKYSDHTVGSAGASLYDINHYQHLNQFLGPTSFEVKTKERDQHPVFYLGMMTHVPSASSSAYDLPWYVGANHGIWIEQDFHVKITKPDGSLLVNYYYQNVQGYCSPSDNGADQVNIGSDMLKILSLIANGLGHPEFGVPIGLESILIKYIPASFSFGKEPSTNGVYLTDWRGTQSDLSDLLVFQANLPDMGTYTVSLQMNIGMYWSAYYIIGGWIYYCLAYHSLNYAFSYYYGD